MKYLVMTFISLSLVIPVWPQGRGIFDAAKKGDVTTITSLINSGTDLNGRNSYGDTILHVAALKGYLSIVQLLINKKSDVHSENSGKSTPLHLAADRGHLDVLEFLIKSGARVNSRDKWGRTPLHLAAGKGHGEVVKKLLSLGADSGIKDLSGKTPLYHVCRLKTLNRIHINIVSMLIKNGSDVNIQISRSTEGYVENENIHSSEIGKAPLHWAVINANTELAELLINSRSKVDIADGNGVTPLHLAAYKADSKIIEMLILKSASINSKDKENDSPLHLAVKTDFPLNGNYWGRKNWIKMLNGRDAYFNALDKKKNRLGITALLIKKGADVNAEGKSKMTPLHWASYNGFIEIAKLLLLNKAKIDLKDRDGMTPLYLALREGHRELSRFLILSGADVNNVIPRLPDEEKEKNSAEEIRAITPMHRAVENGFADIVEMMLKKGARFDIKDKHGRTPLYISLQKNQTGICKQLIHSGASVNVRDEYGNSLLHIASEKGNTEIARLLVKKGVDTKAKNEEGKTPGDLASIREMKDILK